MRPLKVLVACEFSGVVREAFEKAGHDAWSCDLRKTTVPGKHFQCPVEDILPEHPDKNLWDLMIAFPPCTHLAVSGARWFKDKQKEQESALSFVRMLMDAPIPRIALENPVSVISTRIRKPDQIIHPWQFGHRCRKRTCLWLKNLPNLEPTDIVDEGEIHVTKGGRRIPQWYNLPHSKGRADKRSITFQGIADAMAVQWNV